MNDINSIYEVILADTEESKEIHFKLRYKVFCLEKGYEDAKKFPDEMEKDKYDGHAIHFIVRHKLSRQWVGAFRIIMGRLPKLPIHQHAIISGQHTIKTELQIG